MRNFGLPEAHKELGRRLDRPELLDPLGKACFGTLCELRDKPGESITSITSTHVDEKARFGRGCLG